MTMTPTQRLYQSHDARRSVQLDWGKRIGIVAAITFIAWLLMIVWTVQADAKGYRHHHRHHHHRVHHFGRHHVAYDSSGNSASIIGGRPTDCPHQYCGCALRKYLGFADKSLDLAWNWAVKFPRTFAHAGAAAVRHGHVMLIERMTGPNTAVVRTYNSGHGLSYIIERSLRGYVFVDPRGGRFASAL